MSTFRKYCGRLAERWFGEATPWARDNIFWGAIVLVVPPLAAWLRHGTIDWPTVRMTLWFYLTAFVIYAAFHVVRTAWKLDSQRENDLTGLEKEKEDAQKQIKQKDLYVAELQEKFSNIGGPNLFLAYDYRGSSGYKPLIIVNFKGEFAYDVAIKIPEDGSIVSSRPHEILRDDEGPAVCAVGHRNSFDAADLIMLHEDKSPIYVTCMDSDCRRFVYRFEPSQNGSRFRLADKRCIGRA